MNISNSISEINLPSNVYGSQKVYLWPVYNAGVVDPVFRISRETDGQIIKTNVPVKEREKIMSDSQKLACQTYAPNGLRSSNSIIPLGSLFDAYV